MKTFEQAYIDGLLALGEREIMDRRHRTWRVFTRTRVISTGKPETRDGLRYFVDSNGAIRLGKTRPASAPLTNKVKSILAEIGGRPA